MTAEVVFKYWLTGDGFFDAVFRIGDARLDLHQLGDSPDPLEELMSAALALARGEELPLQLFWDPEDGTDYRWHLSRRGDRLQIRVAHVDSHTPSGRDGGYGAAPVAFDAECRVESFCHAIAERAAELLVRYGPDRYAELTFGPFPFELLAELRLAIEPAPG